MSKKLFMTIAGIVVLCALTGTALATDYYVATSGDDSSNGTSWAAAWLTISNAVYYANDNDTVTVSNGTYNITTEISITNGVIVQALSSNPADTVVSRNTTNLHRIFYLAHSNALVAAFTITNGHLNANHEYGAGVYIATNGTVSNCVIIGNRSCTGESVGTLRHGGGVCCYYGGMVQNCEIIGNTGVLGGGVYCTHGGTVRNCVIRGNSSVFSLGGRGGGVYLAQGGTIESCTITENTGSLKGAGVYFYHGGAMWNSICMYNDAPNNPNYDGEFPAHPKLYYCCATPLKTGADNIDSDPQFVDRANNNYRLRPGSPCMNSGTNQAWMAGAKDLDGNARTNGTVDMGPYEYWAGDLDCNLIPDTAMGFDPFTVIFTGYAEGTNTDSLCYKWDFTNSGVIDIQGEIVTNTYTSGVYSVRLVVTNAVGETASRTNTSYIKAGPSVAYVSTNGGHSFPYTGWTTAATNIQDAVDAGVDGTTVWLTNGTYVLAAQITITNGITVKSVNGHAATLVDGNNSVGCFYISHSNAVVDSITITNGSNWLLAGGVYFYYNGGTVSNCLITGSIQGRGGGIHFRGNGLAHNCIITRNYSGSKAGGAYCYLGGTLRNCLISGNYSAGVGGVDMSYASARIENCTITRNEGENAGGVYSYYCLANYGCNVQNSIIYNNTVSNWHSVAEYPDYENCCTTPSIGDNCVTNDPQFVNSGSGYGLSFTNGNYKLVKGSPCIDVGTNVTWVTETGARDLGGNPRLFNVIVDIGAYEWKTPKGTFIIFY